MVFCKISVINLEEKINFVWCAFFPEKFGGGVRPASQNPYPIYDLTKNMTRLARQNPVSDLHYN